MPSNRSVPANVILPHICYRNVAAASAWLATAFGFTEYYRYGDPVAGVMMHLGEAWIMLTELRQGRAVPAATGAWTQMLTVFVDDVETHYDRAQSAGATIVEELHETGYGERQYGAEDPDGHLWLFSCHARDVSPREWGASPAASGVI